MGVDIRGWIEVREEWKYCDEPVVNWRGVILIDNLVNRSYDMFGLLFGIYNYSNLPPVATRTELPNDLSAEAIASYIGAESIDDGKEDFDELLKQSDEPKYFAKNWLLWSEIAAMDRSVSAVDGRPHSYKRGVNGALVYEGKAAPAFRSELPDGVPYEEGQTWERDGLVFRIERISRSQILAANPDWHLLFTLMEKLAGKYGADGVRMAVWFDS